MASSNINFSINNVPQVDRHFNDAIRVPFVTQQQNVEDALNETARKLMMPPEVTHTEQKITDPDDRKQNNTKKSKKRGKKKANLSNKGGRKNGCNGFFIDVEG